MSSSFKPFRVEKYLLFEKLASGGMAEVYLAKLVGAADFSKFVAIKRILPNFTADANFRIMFEQEARFSSSLSHGNIAQTLDFIQEDDGYFLVMEFINGKNLREVLDAAKSKGISLPFEFSFYIVQEICKGLEYAHTKKDDSRKLLRVLHRDISPHNIMVGFDGSIKIVDFGLAKTKDGSHSTQAGTLKGKFAYMSPEQAHCQELDARTDVYSTGLVLYELLTNRRAYQGKTEMQLLKAAQEVQFLLPQKVNPEISAPMQEIILRAMAPDREQRFSSAMEFGTALQEYLSRNKMAVSQVDIAGFMENLFPNEIERMTRKLAEPLPLSVESGEHKVPAKGRKHTKDLSIEQKIALAKKSLSMEQEDGNKFDINQLMFVLKLVGVTFVLLLVYKRYGETAKRNLATFLAKPPSTETGSNR